MATKTTPAPFDLATALETAFATNNRINIYLIQNIPDDAWRATPPGGKGRTIASITAHIHNVRLMWLKSVDKDADLPQKLDPETVTKDAAITALNESYAALAVPVHNSLAGDGRIKGFKPDVGSFLGYLFAHDGHHRGQITMLARQTGHPVGMGYAIIMPYAIITQ